MTDTTDPIREQLMELTLQELEELIGEQKTKVVIALSVFEDADKFFNVVRIYLYGIGDRLKVLNETTDNQVVRDRTAIRLEQVRDLIEATRTQTK